jgi:hypothetical protein
MGSPLFSSLSHQQTTTERTTMFGLIIIIVLGTSIWVGTDARRIGAKKGQLKGVCDMGPAGWFFACLMIWIVAFPMYLANRAELKRINGQSSQPVAASVASPEAQDFEVQLMKLARLKESGVLSQEEFDAKKKAILNI